MSVKVRFSVRRINMPIEVGKLVVAVETDTQNAERAALLDYYSGNDRNADLSEGAFEYAPGKFF